MAPPQIDVGYEKIFDTGVNNLKIRVRRVVPATNADFISTSSQPGDANPGRARVAAFSENTSLRVASNQFYVGNTAAKRIEYVPGTDNIYLNNAAGSPVVLVEIK